VLKAYWKGRAEKGPVGGDEKTLKGVGKENGKEGKTLKSSLGGTVTRGTFFNWVKGAGEKGGTVAMGGIRSRGRWTSCVMKRLGRIQKGGTSKQRKRPGLGEARKKGGDRRGIMVTVEDTQDLAK